MSQGQAADNAARAARATLAASVAALGTALARQPRQPLACLPTPLQELQRLPRAVAGHQAPRVLVKRDDLTGLGLGGNKVRKLEFLVAEALAAGADTLITAGAVQSNHCRQTAAAAARTGLACHLALAGEPPAANSGNLLLDQLFGAHLHFCGDHRKGEDIPELLASLTAQGKQPFAIPYGGSSAVGSLGFVQAALELQQQLASRGDSISHVLFASSSGATHAGLHLGNALLGNPWQLLGISIDRQPPNAASSLQDFIQQLSKEAAALLDMPAPASTPLLLTGYLGAGYGQIGAQEQEALRLMAQLEGLVLDPVYTGKAMAGLIDLLRRGQFQPGDTLVFWHTGGAPALFAAGSAAFQPVS